MADPAELFLFVQLAIVLGVARGLGRIARQIGIAPVIGELLTGFVIGPSMLAAIAPDVYATLFPAGGAVLAPFAALGLVFLLVLAGIETDVDFIRRHSYAAVSMAVGGMVVPFGLGFGLAWVLPATYVDAGRVTVGLFLAVALSISAVPVTARILTDLDVIDRDIGQLILAAAMLTDIVGWLLLALVVNFAMTGQSTLGGLLRASGSLVLFVLLAGTVGLRGVDLALERFADDSSPMVSGFSLVVLATIVGVAAALWLAIEAAIGAFVVGLTVGQSKFLDRESVEILEVVTLGLFAPIFFGTAGIEANLTAFLSLDAGAVALLILVVAVVGKFGGVYLAARILD